MIKVGSFNTNDLEKRKLSLNAFFNEAVINNSSIPASLRSLIYPDRFLSSEQYLLFPLFFQQAFKSIENKKLNELCVSGYLYFKHLICVDSILDKDIADEHENAVPESIVLLRSHTYHEESIKMLAHLFNGKSIFWDTWKLRNKAFLESIIIDKHYDMHLSWDNYKKMSEGKCSFLKASVDSFYYYPGNKKRRSLLYKKIVESLDKLAVGRCLQDDFEDFKKDLIHKKNNYGHVLLNRWMEAQGKNFQEFSPHILEKYFYISRVAEELLKKSKDLFNDAINMVLPYKEELPEYVRMLEGFRNKSNIIKVNTEAYRITAMLEKIKLNSFVKINKIDRSLSHANEYISSMQASDGSWYEISNKQGLSNVWATAFISMQLLPGTRIANDAIAFLNKNRQNDLWGYNTDWLDDFDSTTCALMAIKNTKSRIDKSIGKWFVGQHESGGFSTYSRNNTALSGYLGFSNTKFIKEWTKPHVCVSALAFFFLTSLKEKNKYPNETRRLKNFLIKNITDTNNWEPYWWTSSIYSTMYVIKGLLNEGYENNKQLIDSSIKTVLSRQQRDGSFKCDKLGKKSVFYTAMVLDGLCQNAFLFRKFNARIEKMKDWILSKQYENGAFESSNFLLIPFSSENNKNFKYKINLAGGTGFVTGEIAGLFTTAVASKALNNYLTLKSNTSND